MRFVRGCHKFDVITWDRATLSHKWRSTVAKEMLYRVRSVSKNIVMGYMSCRGRVEEPAKVVQSPPGGVGSADVSHISARELSLAFCRWLEAVQ